MADFLFLLARINLAMGAAIVVVALLRRPVRAAFHAPIAYALWLLVPAVVVAALLPPRVAAPGPVQQVTLLIGRHIPVAAPQTLPTDWSWLVFAAWAVGAGVMALAQLRLQRDFQRAERVGAAGPAVVGFFRPRIVMPADFESRFSAPQRAAIWAHERAHLARQDSRVNAVTALLRCLCWFNPLVHMASAWLRRDQELACDAAALRTVPRLDYANALIQAQMPGAALPLGCAWPGTEHPLTERVALLKRPAPRAARRRTGHAVIAAVMLGGGVAAWAQQPPTAAKVAPTPPMGGAKRFGLVVTGRAGSAGPVSYLTINGGKLEEHADGSSRLSGAVAMQFPYGTAEADNAALTRTGTVTLTDNVKLQYGDQVMRGNKLMFEARTGQLEMDGRKMPSGMPPSGN